MSLQHASGKQVLHHNEHCQHHAQPTTLLRILCMKGDYSAARRELERLRGMPLPPEQRLIADIQETVMWVRRDLRNYERAKRQLRRVTAEVHQLGDPYFLADLRAYCLYLAGRCGDYVLADHLTNNFFADGLDRHDIVIDAHWRLGIGRRYHLLNGPAAATSFYLTAERQLNGSGTNRHCLLEMAGRRLAFCDYRGAPLTAVEVLQRVGVPAAIAPGPGEVAIEAAVVAPTQ